MRACSSFGTSSLGPSTGRTGSRAPPAARTAAATSSPSDSELSRFSDPPEGDSELIHRAHTDLLRCRLRRFQQYLSIQQTTMSSESEPSPPAAIQPVPAPWNVKGEVRHDYHASSICSHQLAKLIAHAPSGVVVRYLHRPQARSWRNSAYQLLPSAGDSAVQD